MIKRIFLMALVGMGGLVACAQKGLDVINAKEVLRIEGTLASDEMRGRRTGTPDIDKAALFIADEFKKAGLQPVKGSYLQPFTMVTPKPTLVKLEMEEKDEDVRR